MTGPTERALSAGGVILRPAGSTYETVIVGRDGLWLLPKGTPRGNEPLEHTARREVGEETGLDVRLLAPVGTIYYIFRRAGREVAKTVLFYVMDMVGGDVGRHDEEYDTVQWVPLEEARRLLSYENYRTLLDGAVTEYERVHRPGRHHRS